MFRVYAIAYGDAAPTLVSTHRSSSGAARRLGSLIRGKRSDPAYYAIYCLDDSGARWSANDLRIGRRPTAHGHVKIQTGPPVPTYR